MRTAARLAVILSVPVSLGAQNATPQVDLKALADSVASTGTTLERTRTLVHWVNDNFTWSYTDYVKRTPQEIVARRAGNCAELASVLRAFLDASGTKSRWIREINVQPQPTPRRQNTAAAMVTQRGLSYSVFGLQHNDHVWLEVWDDATQSWFPADPAYGVVGVDEWLPARLAMANRPKPRVPAVVPIAADMLVPFVVIAGEQRSGPYTEDRTDTYLVDGFNNLYGGRLTALPSWSKWVEAVHSLSPHARAAFDGKENLHRYNGDIAKLKMTYDDLSREASAKGVRIQDTVIPRRALSNGSRLGVPGGQIWYRVVGGGQGTPVILLHGGPGNPSVYLKSLEALADERLVVRYDQLGAGYSDVVHDTSLFNITRFVEELELLRRQLALERVNLYGHSWGATLALEYYRAHPQHVASLTLASETLDLPAFAANVRRLFAEMPDSLARAVRLRASGQPYDSGAFQAAMTNFRSHFQRTPVRAEMDTLMKLQNPEIAAYMNGTSPFTPAGTLRQYDATPFLSQVKVPVLFTVGEFDVAGPENVKRHASLTPGARLVVIPGAGHHTQWDNLPATLAAVRSFLRDVDSRR